MKEITRRVEEEGLVLDPNVDYLKELREELEQEEQRDTRSPGQVLSPIPPLPVHTTETSQKITPFTREEKCTFFLEELNRRVREEGLVLEPDVDYLEVFKAQLDRRESRQAQPEIESDPEPEIESDQERPLSRAESCAEFMKNLKKSVQEGFELDPDIDYLKRFQDDLDLIEQKQAKTTNQPTQTKPVPTHASTPTSDNPGPLSRAEQCAAFMDNLNQSIQQGFVPDPDIDYLARYQDDLDHTERESTETTTQRTQNNPGPLSRTEKCAVFLENLEKSVQKGMILDPSVDYLGIFQKELDKFENNQSTTPTTTALSKSLATHTSTPLSSRSRKELRTKGRRVLPTIYEEETRTPMQTESINAEIVEPQTIPHLGSETQEIIGPDIITEQTETASNPEQETAYPQDIEDPDDIGTNTGNRSSELKGLESSINEGPTSAAPTDAIGVDPACVQRPISSRPRRHERFYTNLYQEQ